MSQHASNLRLAIALGVAAFTVWAAYVIAHLLTSG